MINNADPGGHRDPAGGEGPAGRARPTGRRAALRHRGPRAAPPPVAHLSDQRAAVLDRLRRHPDGARISELAEESGLHANTLREHLDALAADGYVERRRAAPRGRGRPAWIYAAGDSAGPATPHADPRLRDYAGLAMSLASILRRVSTDVERDGLAAGVEWGRNLAREHRGTGTPEQRLVQLLTELGFAPTLRGDGVSLRQCPLIDAARTYPDVVCTVHRGIVRGALAEFGGDPHASTLTAFAEPDACRLEITPVRPRDNPGGTDSGCGCGGQGPAGAPQDPA
ncbi:helix-turn-helix transcriptional regulator [Tomitella fengzijianii]|uniref:helix-turn-helix transcriptional regulator n=1 Tax=Tomitella fengzijianii TaxID=2597660 RepID=UPI001E2B6273|nr:helix-turn-helix domain-containing protein [Tomitella fengzijianii]